MMTYQIIHNDILKWAANYTGPKFHAAFMDPPYHLVSITKRFGKANSAPAKGDVYRRSSAGFMNTQWDGLDETGKGIAFRPEMWAALTEHLYPGGFIMAFASTRGFHRMMVAMEDAELIIHPTIFFLWNFLSGFPKATRIPDERFNGHRYGGQAMKPAVEPIIVAQKPYRGRPVDCITTTGAGALNIDGGRIPGQDYQETARVNSHKMYGVNIFTGEGDKPGFTPNDSGRWPANLILDEAGAELLDRQSGEMQSHPPGNTYESSTTKSFYGQYGNRKLDGYDDSGGASRMFFQSHWSYEILEQLENADSLRYEPKVSTAEREAGLDELPERLRHRMRPDADPEKLTGLNTEPRFAPVKLKNHHPCLKPISLTKYLATLLLPPDAYAPRRICVPFGGSGSEAIGCVLAGWDEVVMIEGSADYIPIAEVRLAWWSRWPEWGQRNVEKILASTLAKQDERQLALFEVAE